MHSQGDTIESSHACQFHSLLSGTSHVHNSRITSFRPQLILAPKHIYADPTEDVEAADPVRIRLAGGISVPHRLDASAVDDAPLEAADEIPAKSRFLAAVASTGFVRFFSFMKSESGKEEIDYYLNACVCCN